MTRLDPLPPDSLTDAARELHDTIVNGPRAGAPGLTDEHGALRGPFGPLLRSPAIGAVVQELGATLRFHGALPDDLRELAIVRTAAHWQCDFELSAHGPLAERAGVPVAAIAAITEGRSPQLDAASAQRLVHDATAEVLTSQRLSDDTYSSLIETLGEPQTVELLLVVGYYALLALLLEGFEIRP